MTPPLHLLIVDDQPDSVAGVVGYLQDGGHRVDVSTDSIAALRLLADADHRRDFFNLILVDVNLPGLDGPGLVRELRQRGDLTPAAFVTGYQSVAARLRGDLGTLRVLGLLTKPIAQSDLDHLLEEVSRHARVLTQDRRSSEFGLGSGGHQVIGGPGLGSGGHPVSPSAKIGSGGHQGLGSGGYPGIGSGGYPGVGSGGHRQLGTTPGAPSAPDEPFLGTSRSFRAKQVTPAPTEGILARVNKPPATNDIIPDTVISGRHRATDLPPPKEVRSEAGFRRSERTPLPAPVPTPGQTPGPTTGGKPRAAPEASGFFPATQPLGGTGALRRLSDLPAPGMGSGSFRDPVTGNLKRPPSGLFVPEHNPREVRRSVAPEPTRPATTSRFHRSVQSGQPPLTSRQVPALPASARIRRTMGNLAPAAPVPVEMPSCTVACAHCQGQFEVVIKDQAYTVLCVHCGQLNRIDPL